MFCGIVSSSVLTLDILLQIEEMYTNEALKSEEKEKRLQDELVESRRRAEITNTAVVDTKYDKIYCLI